MGGFGQAPAGEAVSQPETEKPLVEAILDVMKYGEVTVEVIDDSGGVIASYMRHLDHPDADVPVELTNPEEYSYRLRAGENESHLIRF